MHIHRRHSALVFVSFVLVLGHFYFILQRPSVRQSQSLDGESLERSTDNNELSNIIETHRKIKQSEKVIHERYELIEKYKQESLSNSNSEFKRILFWNEAYGSKNYGVGFGSDALRKAGCPVWQCETSDDRRDVDEYDAVLFHLRSWTEIDLPQNRSSHQRYVFWSIESAAWRFVNTDPMANFFNWTMTYRWDSDIVNPYGHITPTGNVPLHPSADQMKHYLASQDKTVNYAEGKTKMAAWFVSNCASHSGRMEMVNTLKKYIDVDVYGECGTMVCPRKREDECRKMAATKYKFYLSLENSLCLDYVTEKFFGMMHHPIVPVVVGFHDHHEKIAPTHSFINAANFANVQQLAEYLVLLDKNDTLYNEYFWWKPHFKVRNSEEDFNRGMCHLCAALHDTSLPTKIYSDMTQWWDKKATCRTLAF